MRKTENMWLTKTNRSKLFGSSLLFLLLVGLATIKIPMVQGQAVCFNSAYGGDPGRDAVMNTTDDLDYFPVLIAARFQRISFLTVDCQHGQIWPGWGPMPMYMQEDAHANFRNIAYYTEGFWYNWTLLEGWDTAIVTEIKKRIGSGPGDVVFTFDVSASMGWDVSLMPDLRNRTMGIVDALGALNVGFGLGIHVDYPFWYDPQANYNYTGWMFSWYGNPGNGDYPWQMNLDITLNRTLMKNAINSSLTNPNFDGADMPQDYARVVYETQFFSWRPNAKRIVVMYGDAPAHSAPSGLYPPPPPIPSPPVGGIIISIDKFGLLAPHIALASAILAATVATAIYVKRVKRKKEKQ